MMQKIKFKENEYLMVGGAITTIERYKSGTVSIAHLSSDGIIRQYGKEIGSRLDIEIIEEIEDIEGTPEGIMNMLSGRSWF